jgi:diacylglycerol O-acyltransferase / wax synthase
MERLSANDLFTLWWDDFGWPGDIGALAILDGTSLLDPGGRFRIEAVRAVIGARLHLLPRFRQLLYRPPRGLGWPLWVDALSFELADHVGVVPVPAPGDQAQLLLACERLRRRRLDPARPRWEAWFLPGLPSGGSDCSCECTMPWPTGSPAGPGPYSHAGGPGRAGLDAAERAAHVAGVA